MLNYNNSNLENVLNLVKSVREKRVESKADFTFVTPLFSKVGEVKISIEAEPVEIQVPSRTKQGQMDADIELKISIDGGKIRKINASELVVGYINNDNSYETADLAWSEILKAICEDKKITISKGKWFKGKGKAADGACPEGFFDYKKKTGETLRYENGDCFYISSID
jgi:hypothetical protein